MSDEGSMKSNQIRDLDPSKINSGLDPSKISSGNNNQIIKTVSGTVTWADSIAVDTGTSSGQMWSESGNGTLSVPGSTNTTTVNFTNTYTVASGGVGYIRNTGGSYEGGDDGHQGGFMGWDKNNGNIIGVHIRINSGEGGTSDYEYYWNVMGVIA